MEANSQNKQELDRLTQAYSIRKNDLYSFLNPEVYFSRLDLNWKIIKFLKKKFFSVSTGSFSDLKMAEIGCGSGTNLLDFLQMGFSPQNITGIEYLHDRVLAARLALPSEIVIIEGDATYAEVEKCSNDLIYISLVFSSLLDDSVQDALAAKVWEVLRPGGVIVWYDFVFDNPSNTSVRAVSLERVKALFPEGKFKSKRVTLAPPISRRVCQIHPALWGLFNLFPFLRTHKLIQIEKSD